MIDMSMCLSPAETTVSQVSQTQDCHAASVSAAMANGEHGVQHRMHVGATLQRKPAQRQHAPMSMTKPPMSAGLTRWSRNSFSPFFSTPAAIAPAGTDVSVWQGEAWWKVC